MVWAPPCLTVDAAPTYRDRSVALQGSNFGPKTQIHCWREIQGLLSSISLLRSAFVRSRAGHIKSPVRLAVQIRHCQLIATDADETSCDQQLTR